MMAIRTIAFALSLILAAISLFSSPSFAQSSVCAVNQFESDIVVSTSPMGNVLGWSANPHWHYDYTNRGEYATMDNPQGGSTNIIRKLSGEGQVEYIWTTSAQGDVSGCQLVNLPAPLRDARWKPGVHYRMSRDRSALDPVYSRLATPGRYRQLETQR